MTLFDILVLAESLSSLSIGWLKGINKLLPTFHWVSISNQGIPTYKHLGLFNTTIYSRGVRKDCISSNWLMSSRDVKCWTSRFDVLSHRESIGNGDFPSGRLIHGFLDNINIDPAKLRFEFFIISGVIVDNMLVGPDNMLIGSDGWKSGQWLGRVIQTIESLDNPMPKFIKIRIKGKSLIGVIGSRRLPITR